MATDLQCSDEEIARYTCYRTNQSIQIDGNLDEAVWQKAPRSERFVDMVTGDPGYWDTRVATLWDDQNFYVGFWIEEPFVEGVLTGLTSSLLLFPLSMVLFS